MNDLLVRWVSWVSSRATPVLFAIAVVTLMAGWIAITQFRMNSDLSELIDQSSGWRQDFDRFQSEFPDLVRTAVIVVASESTTGLEHTTADILSALQADPSSFTAVRAPGAEAFYRDHAFLYMSQDALDNTTDRLATAQPWLAAVAADPSLRGVLELIDTALQNAPAEEFESVLAAITDALYAAQLGNEAPVAWADVLLPRPEVSYQLIFLKSPGKFSAALPDAELMQSLRTMLGKLDIPDTVTVNITGEVALQHEEIEAAVAGVTLAGWLALVLLLIVLIVGVRSLKIIVATFTMLAVGVVWTSAAAMLTVGEYNTLSVVFLVMFFGLGVDFALHFSLRYQEAGNSGEQSVSQALVLATRSVGRAITLCTLTTAIGFMGFFPTAYAGLADLGLISATGMIIAWFLTFTYLPAFFARLAPPRAHNMDVPSSAVVVQSLLRWRGLVLVSVVVLGGSAAYLAQSARFDYSVLAIKDPASESMRTLRTLQAQKLSTDYQLALLSDETLDKLPLLSLSVVDSVRTPADLVPGEQAEKLLAIDDLNLLLESALEPLVTEPSIASGEVKSSATTSATQLLNTLQHLRQDDAQDWSADVLQKFQNDLEQLQTSGDEQVWATWEKSVITHLLSELAWLRRATAIDAITLEDVPQSILSHLVSPAGQQLNVVLPAEDIAEVSALSSFIEQVREVAPTATGRPVIEWGVGGIVLASFREALLYALIGITLVLLIALRSVTATILVLVPLVLAGVMSLAVGVLLGLPVNMANILVIPLIFGLGVDNGIHMVDRYLGGGLKKEECKGDRKEDDKASVAHLLHSSTPRAVLLSTLTTLGAFAALSLSPHQGTASIGVLLTLSIGFLLMFTIFLLPVFLASVPGLNKSTVRRTESY